MMVGNKQVFYEFGPERGYGEQHAAITSGLAILKERFGEAEPIRVFTPPRHRYDRNTLRALSAAGFTVLSASSYPGVAYRAAYAAGRLLGLTNIGRPGVSHHGRMRSESGLFELSVAVAVDHGSAPTKSVNSIIRSIDVARRHTRDVGLMFHHESYADVGARDFLENLADRLLRLPNVTFHTITGLHAGYIASQQVSL